MVIPLLQNKQMFWEETLEISKIRKWHSSSGISVFEYHPVLRAHFPLLAFLSQTYFICHQNPSIQLRRWGRFNGAGPGDGSRAAMFDYLLPPNQHQLLCAESSSPELWPLEVLLQSSGILQQSLQVTSHPGPLSHMQMASSGTSACFTFNNVSHKLLSSSAWACRPAWRKGFQFLVLNVYHPLLVSAHFYPTARRQKFQ